MVQHVEGEMRRQAVANVFHTHFTDVLNVPLYHLLALATHQQINRNGKSSAYQRNDGPENNQRVGTVNFLLLFGNIVLFGDESRVLLVAHIDVGHACLYLHVTQGVFDKAVFRLQTVSVGEVAGFGVIGLQIAVADALQFKRQLVMLHFLYDGCGFCLVVLFDGKRKLQRAQMSFENVEISSCQHFFQRVDAFGRLLWLVDEGIDFRLIE